MGRIADMERLLAVENDVRLTTMVCPGTDLLLWPMVRTPFLRLILSDLLYDTPIPAAPAAGRKTRMLGLAQAGLHNLTSRDQKARVLIRSSPMGGDLRHGKRFHRISDYFVDHDPAGTVVLEDLGGSALPRNRYNRRVKYHDPILIRATLAAHSSVGQHIGTAKVLVDLLETRAKDHLGWALPSKSRDWYLALVARYIARARYLLTGYTAMLRRVSPKLLIAEEACYGNTMICLIAAARSLGITTAENQHGMVSKGHDVYALAPILAASAAYKKMLPDFFLGYGPWWNAQLQVPVTPVVIGNPHGDMMRSTIKPLSGSKTGILVLGDGVESNKYIKLACDLASALPDRKITLRPHPQEREFFAKNYPTGQIDAVTIDRSPDIYASLAASHIVISEMSTGLFEALGLADRVFMWDTPKARFTLPEHPFETFKNVTSLTSALSASKPHTARHSPQDIWAPNWQDNYSRFVKEVVGS